jgi:hypothetical protein
MYVIVKTVELLTTEIIYLSICIHYYDYYPAKHRMLIVVVM